MTSGFPATEEMAGRTCPYCHFKLEPGGEVIECSVCKAVHHGECWEENGGCAVALCAGGPSLSGTRQAEPPPPAPNTEPITVSLPPAPAPPPRRPPVAAGSKAGAGAPTPPTRSSRAPLAGWVPLTAAVVLLLGGATAAAVVLTGQGDQPSGAGEVGAPEARESSTAGFEEPEEGFEEEEERFEAEPPPNPEQRAEGQIQHALTAHFDRLVRGQYYAAYDDLTPREGEDIGGETGWVEAQAEDDLQSFDLELETTLLDPHSATATIVEFETHSVATGCNEWFGHWEMSKVYGEWLIAAAKLENEPC